MQKHWVKQFVGGVGITHCGIASESITAYPNEITCSNCKRGEAAQT